MGMPPSAVRLWALVTFAFAFLLFYMHRRPTLAYPLTGVMLLGAVVVVGLLGGVIGRRLLALGGLWAPGLALAAFVGWAWWRTAASPVPTEGAAELTTLVFGLVAFWMGGFVVGGAARVGGVLGGDERAFARKGAWGVCGFFALAALVMSVHGIVEHFVIYPRRAAMLVADPTFDARDSINASILYTLRLGRVGSWFGNPNVLCGFLAMCVPMTAAWALAWRGRGRVAARVGAILILATMAWAAFLTRSTGGLLVFGVGIVGSAFVAFFANRRVPKVAAAILYLALCAAAMSGGSPDARAQSGEGDSASPRSMKTLRERVYYLRTAWRIWREAPMVGCGLGGYGRLYPKARVLGAGEAKYSHNFVAQIAAETGLVGLALFGAFLGLVAWRAMRGAWSAPRLAMAGACVLFLGDSLGEYTFYVREIFLDFCFLAGCVAASAEPDVMPGRRRWGSALSLPVAGALALAGFFVVAMPDQMVRDYRQYGDDLFAAMAASPPREARKLGKEALDVANRALKWQPENPRLWQMRAQAWAAQGDARASAADFARAAELHPNSASIRAQWADLAWRMGDGAEALRLIGEAIALYPLHSGHHVRRARYLAKLGRRDEALAEAHEAERTAFQPRERREAEALLRELGEMP